MNVSKEIAEVMKNFYDRWSAGDSSFLDDLLTSQNDIVVVGTDPDEWWQGRDTVHKAWSTQFKEMGRVTIKPGRLSAYAHGDTGWAVDDPTLRMPDETQGVAALDVRFRARVGRLAVGSRSRFCRRPERGRYWARTDDVTHLARSQPLHLGGRRKCT